MVTTMVAAASSGRRSPFPPQRRGCPLSYYERVVVSVGSLRTDDFHRDPYSTYKMLRDEHPVFYDAPRSAYVLTRFADVREAARDHVRFSSAATRSEVFDRITRMDPPEHDLWRDLLSARFRPRRIGTLEADVRALARDLLAAGHRRGSFDAVEGFAAP